MAARDWFVEGVQVFEESEEEYFVEGVQFQEFDFKQNSFEYGPNYIACIPNIKESLSRF